jgi:hypothetical protein
MGGCLNWQLGAPAYNWEEYVARSGQSKRRQSWLAILCCAGLLSWDLVKSHGFRCRGCVLSILAVKGTWSAPCMSKKPFAQCVQGQISELLVRNQMLPS